MAVAVVLQVSAPYSKIGFTMVLKILTLVFVVRSEDPHTFLGWKATLAVPIHTFTYVGICLSTRLPRQVRLSALF